MLIKKGAMFGLDARIALAIFGALSVISGAALYSAIQSAKAEAIHQSLKEVEKAMEAYMVDIGNMADYDTMYDIIELSCLAENYGNCDAPAAFWKGPYIGEISSPYWLLNLRVTGDPEFDAKLEGARFAGSAWTGTASDNPNACNNEDCYIYLGYTTEHATVAPVEANMDALINALFTQMDAYLDNGDGERSGIVRKASPPNPAADNAVYFKTSIPDRQG